MDAEALLAWFDGNQRSLPWRTEPRDPYRTWVSEVMLQQTRVETVLRYFDRFLETFPDVASLASAPEERLMKQWEGLGYYRRARLLHAGARAVMERHDGRLPQDFDALLALPGFGPYTAGAVASLAFGLKSPAVDGNVMRVASRLTAMEDDISTPATRRKVEAWVGRHQPSARPGAFNEALMELGATVCTPRAPRCEACPVRASCKADRSGDPARFPVKRSKPRPVEVRIAMAVARRGRKVLVEKREAGLLAGTWGLPYVEVGPEDDPGDALAARVAELTGAAPRVADEPAETGTHVFTHRKWNIEAFLVDVEEGSGEWREPHEVALGTAHRRILARVS